MEEEKQPAQLRIVPVATRASQHIVPPLMEQIGLKHPFSLSIFGNTGSGKTVLALNLLTNESMYGNYFDEVHLFGLTVRADDSWKHLKLPKNNIHDQPHSLISDLRSILEKQKKEVERVGVAKCRKLCLIFEDVTANRKLLNSDEYIKSYVQNRHYGCSTIAMCHKYHAQTRVCRLNSNHHMIFPCTSTEVKRIIDETQPAFLSKKDYEEAINFCFAADEHDQHPFLSAWLWLRITEPSKVLEICFKGKAAILGQVRVIKLA